MSIFSRFSGDQESGKPDPAELRRRMVEEQVVPRGVRDETVLEALRAVPRHLFVPAAHRWAAYADRALPIGYGQTISQPYIVALMTAALRPRAGLRVLEVGTGSGYQAAVLAATGMEVFTVERISSLRERARSGLAEAGYLERVRSRLGDGSQGWPEAAPFDRILVTAAAEALPPALQEQLAEGGFLVAPVGDPLLQTIYRYTKLPGGRWEREALEGARFVPLLSEESGDEAPSGEDAAGEREDGERGEDGKEGEDGKVEEANGRST